MPHTQINDIQLYYEVHGEGYPVVFTHGFTASHRMWEPQVPVISERYEFIVYDLRGHGESESPAAADRYAANIVVEDLYQLLQSLGIRKAVVGGLSLGGYVSLKFYLAHPEMVQALMLMDTGPGFRNPDHREHYNKELAKMAERLETDGIQSLMTEGRKNTPLEVPPHYDPKGLANMARNAVSQHDSLVIDSLGKIDIPTLVLVGENDVALHGVAKYMAKSIPNAEHVVIPNAGHAPNIENALHFNEMVMDFLIKEIV